MSELPISTANKIPEVFEITLSDIYQFIKRYTLKVVLAGLFFGIIGYSVSFMFPVMYKSYSILLPESGSSSNGMGSLSGLARLSGITKNESGGAIQPDLYPQILQTLPFSLYILKQPMVDEDNHQYKSLREFLTKDNKKPTSNDEIKTVHQNVSKDILSLSKSEEQIAYEVLGLLSTVYDVKTDIITISAETSDPVIAAQLVQATSDYLIGYVSDYRTEKTVREVQFLGKRVIEAKKREQDAEYSLQNYRDRNRNAFLNVARIEEQRLQSDYTLAQSLYTDIVRRWEEAKIKVKEQQPVIKVLEPAKIPLNKSKPRRLIFALIFTFIGGIISLSYFIISNARIKRESLI